jgi:hypothetical protein
MMGNVERMGEMRKIPLKNLIAITHSADPDLDGWSGCDWPRAGSNSELF